MRRRFQSISCIHLIALILNPGPLSLACASGTSGQAGELQAVNSQALAASAIWMHRIRTGFVWRHAAGEGVTARFAGTDRFTDDELAQLVHRWAYRPREVNDVSHEVRGRWTSTLSNSLHPRDKDPQRNEAIDLFSRAILSINPAYPASHPIRFVALGNSDTKFLFEREGNKGPLRVFSRQIPAPGRPNSQTLCIYLPAGALEGADIPYAVAHGIVEQLSHLPHWKTVFYEWLAFKTVRFQNLDVPPRLMAEMLLMIKQGHRHYFEGLMQGRFLSDRFSFDREQDAAWRSVAIAFQRIVNAAATAALVELTKRLQEVNLGVYQLGPNGKRFEPGSDLHHYFRELVLLYEYPPPKLSDSTVTGGRERAVMTAIYAGARTLDEVLEHQAVRRLQMSRVDVVRTEWALMGQILARVDNHPRIDSELNGMKEAASRPHDDYTEAFLEEMARRHATPPPVPGAQRPAHEQLIAFIQRAHFHIGLELTLEETRALFRALKEGVLNIPDLVARTGSDPARLERMEEAALNWLKGHISRQEDLTSYQWIVEPHEKLDRLPLSMEVIRALHGDKNLVTVYDLMHSTRKYLRAFLQHPDYVEEVEMALALCGYELAADPQLNDGSAASDVRHGIVAVSLMTAAVTGSYTAVVHSLAIYFVLDWLKDLWGRKSVYGLFRRAA